MSGDPGEYARAFAQGAVGTAVLAIALVLLDAPPADAVAIVAFVGLVCLGAAFGLAAAAVVLYVGTAPSEEVTALARFAGAGAGTEPTTAWATDTERDRSPEDGTGPEQGMGEESDETGGFVFEES